MSLFSSLYHWLEKPQNLKGKSCKWAHIIIFFTILTGILTFSQSPKRCNSDIQYGILDLEFSSTFEETNKVLADWKCKDEGTEKLGLRMGEKSILTDYLFLLAYPLLIIYLLYKAYLSWDQYLQTERWKRINNIVLQLLSISMFVAMFSDAIENYHLWQLIQSFKASGVLSLADQSNVIVAYTFVLIKFISILLCFLYALPTWILKLKPTEGLSK
jgi:hypothetical protein